ncbi:hypothetical protein CP533_1869 [Ophiocordyceps camponoti-saundersi (nom. inval.)]|nr:hypothetical protein CP533_1869 [Ophiocordyceps camponoti-saundersi (nom. inval.)]
MPLWMCDHQGCDRAAVRTLGDCLLCDRHLCSYHLRPEIHTCPEWEDENTYLPACREAENQELARLIRKINTSALRDRASFLRQGKPCSIPPVTYDGASRSSVMGGMNFHVEIRFDDGVEWMARFRRSNASSPPAAIRDYIMRSEVATLMFLEKTAVPTPKVYDFQLEHPGNPVGPAFILMEKLPGKPLEWSTATPEQKQRVMSQLADVHLELHKHPFRSFGSLDTPGDSHIGPFARESLTTFTKSGMQTIGPCCDLQDYYTSYVKLILNLILEEELYSGQPVDAYLIHRFLLDLVPLVVPSSQNEKNFYLKHADDKGDHILVDDQFNITGLIDWEWAHIAPPQYAFNSPTCLLPVAEFYDGNNSLGDDEIIFSRLLEEKGHSELARFVKDGRVQHRLDFCCGYNLMDWDGFLGLFRGLRDAVGMDNDLDWDDWKAVALQRYKNDLGLLQLLKLREERFDMDNSPVDGIDREP